MPSQTPSISGLSLSAFGWPGLPQLPHAWTKEDQADYEQSIARLTVAANLLLSWVDNPEWLAFLDQFLPQLTPISQKVLTKHVIPAVVHKADGWTGLNQHHIIGFMVTLEGKVYTVDVVDVSMERKNAENFLVLLEAAVRKAKSNMGVKIGCIVTDASGTHSILTLRHAQTFKINKQANFIVGDYFWTSDNNLMAITDQARTPTLTIT
ncbi:hypothetical protein H1R20_g11390, partial [Candolleomyces eurysporus]